MGWKTQYGLPFFSKMGMWVLPMVEEASFPNIIIMHQFKPKSKKIINLRLSLPHWNMILYLVNGKCQNIDNPFSLLDVSIHRLPILRIYTLGLKEKIQLLNGIPFWVIPSKAGIHVVIKAFLDSRLRGNDKILAVVVIKNVNSIFKR
jgi:hypothetical protein